MDGVLFDSMPNHARAWEEVMKRHNMPFTARDCYVNEGRTGQDVIHEALVMTGRTDVSEEEIWGIYKEKSEKFHELGGAPPMKDIQPVLSYLQSVDAQIWIVTGSGQKTLFQHLSEVFPGVFTREKMITAYDVTHGKPNAEPYLKAWERSGLKKEQCIVVENAPLGVHAGKAAGLYTIGVNTGILTHEDLVKAGADIVLDNMRQLLEFLQLKDHIEQNVLPWYDTFDKGHNRQHAEKVIKESLSLANSIGGEEVNILMVYAIAAYHDLGLRIDREHHHLGSGTFIRENKTLRQWFSEEEIETMAQAAEDHRASRKEPPRSIYGCIVAEADRDIEPSTILRRTIQFGMKNYPTLSKEEHLQRAYAHLTEKYAEGGYLKLWMHSPRNEQGLAELRRQMHDKESLMQLCSQLYDEEIKKKVQ